jgi:hypothetical protein
MPKNVKVDLIADDPLHDEFVLHLVEDGPWDAADVEDRMRALQSRLYDVVDLVIDGHLVGKYPESKGRRIRIQVDCLNEPEEIREFVAKFGEHIETDPEYRKAMELSQFVSRLRIIANMLKE